MRKLGTSLLKEGACQQALALPRMQLKQAGAGEQGVDGRVEAVVKCRHRTESRLWG